ncbi:MAG TPA: hypothetical protein PK156_49910 [Polyangium sp.]|nr:hypothetical protein [Polyangium sp.]
MAPPRRVRGETLTLRRTGLSDIELFQARESIYLGQYPTQGRFQVAPNAQAVAFTTPGGDSLNIVRRDGRMGSFSGIHRDQFRFSLDGHTLYAARYYNGSFGISRIDTRTLEEVSRFNVANAVWMEACPEGLIVLEYKFAAGVTESMLTLFTSNDEPRVLARPNGHPTRFSCAKAAKNVVYFLGSHIWSIAHPGAEPIQIADVGYDVQNAEMSPDGRKLVVVTVKDTHLFEDGKLVASLGLSGAHTVWFSRDGSQFVVANQQKAHWQSGEKTAELLADEKSPIRTARFAPMSPWVMVARGQDAVRWNPSQSDSETIASAEENQEMLGVDVFAGGVVIWTGTTWELEKRFRSLD